MLRNFLTTLIFFSINFFIQAQEPDYFNNIYSYNGNYTIGMTILDNGDGYVGYGATDDVGIYQMLFLYKISYTGEMQILNTYYEPNTTFYPGNVGGAMIETWDNKLVLAYHYSQSGTSYGALMKLDNNLDTIWKKEYTPAYNTVTLNCFETSDKGFIITGWVYLSEEDYSDPILLKTDSLGNYQWHQIYDGTLAERGQNVIETLDGGYLMGGLKWNPPVYHSMDAMVIKTDSLGNEQWTQYYGNPGVDDDMAHVTMADDGNYLVATVYGEWVVSPTSRTGRIRLLKIDNEGNTIWDKLIGPKERNVYLKNMRHTNDGNLIVAGWAYNDTITDWIYEGLLYKFTQEGDSIWLRDYYYYHNQYDINRFYDVSPTSDNGYIAIGKARPDMGGTNNQMWIVKVDSMGCDTPGCATGVQVFELPDNVGGEFMVWPNPANEWFRVLPPLIPLNGGKPSWLLIYNNQGIKIKAIKIPDGKEAITINVQDWPRGMYFLRLSLNGKVGGSKKIIVN